MNDTQRQKLFDAIVYFCSNTKRCGLVKLFKLLYYTDMLHFRETGRSVTGLAYDAWKFGPVPAALYREIKHAPHDLGNVVRIESPPTSDVSDTAPTHTKIIPKLQRQLSFLTAREKRIIAEVAEIFRDVTAEQISDISHARNGPWDRAWRHGSGSSIDFFDSINLRLGTGVAVPLDELKERAEEMDEVMGF